jgi:hypothetical protein
MSIKFNYPKSILPTFYIITTFPMCFNVILLLPSQSSKWPYTVVPHQNIVSISALPFPGIWPLLCSFRDIDSLISIQYNNAPNVVPSSPNLVTLMMEKLGSSETLVVITAKWRNIPEYVIFHSHRRENLKSYTL